MKPPRSLVFGAAVGYQLEAAWSDGHTFVTDAKLGKGRLRLATGLVRLDLANGVRMTLEGPADLELLGPTEAYLRSGQLTANVPPDAHGFQVRTERAKVIDLGVPDEWVAWFRDAVQPGTVTVVLLLEDLDVGALAQELTRFPFARLVHTTLPEASMRLLEESLADAFAGR